MNLRPLDPQFPAARSPPFANDRILSATNDLDTGEHSRTSAKSAVLLHGLLHDLSTQGFTSASERVSPLHKVSLAFSLNSPSAKLGWGLLEVLTR